MMNTKNKSSDSGTPGQEARSDNLHEPQNNPSQSSPGDEMSMWIRLLYMILFLIVFGVVEAVLYVTTIICFLTHLLSKEPLPMAVEFGQTLSTYVAQIVEFLTYNRASPPWPFNTLN